MRKNWSQIFAHVSNIQVVRLLTARGLEVRVLTRDPVRARQLEGSLVEIVSGDVRDRAAVERAVAGVETIVSAIHGFAGTRDTSPRTVDLEGNSNLTRAAATARAGHFILVSVQGQLQTIPWSSSG